MLTRKPPPRREAKQTTYRPAMEPARAVMRRVDEAMPRPATTPTPRRAKGRARATTAETDHMGRVARLACVLCVRLMLAQESKTDVHHLRTEQGGAQRASNWLVAALCHSRCHQGPHGVHGDRALLRQAKCTELDLLAWTLADLAQEAPR